mmetsp:Transcript_20894/g.52803  ORF Transcript_20894/g.52803 Transcript_20894/m.52803 type:complete len:210 (+) Transcript_20894:952-1581(+)
MVLFGCFGSSQYFAPRAKFWYFCPWRSSPVWLHGRSWYGSRPGASLTQPARGQPLRGQFLSASLNAGSSWGQYWVSTHALVGHPMAQGDPSSGHAIASGPVPSGLGPGSEGSCSSLKKKKVLFSCAANWMLVLELGGAAEVEEPQPRVQLLLPPAPVPRSGEASRVPHAVSSKCCSSAAQLRMRPIFWYSSCSNRRSEQEMTVAKLTEL